MSPKMNPVSEAIAPLFKDAGVSLTIKSRYPRMYIHGPADDGCDSRTGQPSQIHEEAQLR